MAKKARGRRLEKQKKLQDTDAPVADSADSADSAEKAPIKITTDHSKQPKVVAHSDIAVKQASGEIPSTFYGLVDPQESAYFKEAENTLNINVFENEEDRKLYVNSVFAESKGKELKLVTNQICSKLVERLVLNGTTKQIKSMFRSFSGQFVALAHHKYSSHCLETLFVRAAALVEKEMLGEEDDNEGEENSEDDELYASMETLFIYMLNELKPYLQEIVSHQYASHVLRVILLILGGKELPSTTVGTSVLRSKKSKVARKMIEIKDNKDFQRNYQILESFKEELNVIMSTIREGQTRESLRNLAIDKVASPVLQLIIQVEGMVDRERPLYHMIFLPLGEESEKQEGAFVEYLLSDPVGSHFLEAVVRYGLQKNVDRLYRLYMKDRLLKLVKRENTGLFVVEVLLFKLAKGEVKWMLEQLVPEINELIDINLDIGKAIIDASGSHKDYKKTEIIQQILQKYSHENMAEDILKLSTSTLGNTNDDWPTAEERWRTLFFSKLVEYDPQLLNYAIDSYLNLSQERLIQMCYHGVFSHAIESVLIVDNVDIIKRRKLLNCFTGQIENMSCNAYGSHIVDKLWDFTVKLTNYKERIAGELFAGKDKVKESTYGRQVWKNWKMDLFIRKRSDWRFLIKEQELEKFPPKPADDKKPEDAKKPDSKFGGNGFDSKKRQSNDNAAPENIKKQKLRGRHRQK